MIIRDNTIRVIIRSLFSKSTHIRSISFQLQCAFWAKFWWLGLLFMRYLNNLNMISVPLCSRASSVVNIFLVLSSAFAALLEESLGNGLNVATLQPNSVKDLLSYDWQKQKSVCVADKLTIDRTFICKLIQHRRLHTHLQCKPIKSGLSVRLSIWFDPHDHE